MSSLDEELDKISKDDRFMIKFPAIANVASFLDSVHKTTLRTERPYILYEQLGISDTVGFIRLLREGDERAIGKYLAIQDICGFS